jgi:hypothetical protein
MVCPPEISEAGARQQIAHKFQCVLPACVSTLCSAGLPEKIPKKIPKKIPQKYSPKTIPQNNSKINQNKK